jgi:hypothetical protein
MRTIAVHHYSPVYFTICGVVSWSRRFDEPIELPDGRKLKTLAEAMARLAKEVPMSEHKMEKVQNAAHFWRRLNHSA